MAISTWSLQAQIETKQKRNLRTSPLNIICFENYSYIIKQRHSSRYEIDLYLGVELEILYCFVSVWASQLQAKIAK